MFKEFFPDFGSTFYYGIEINGISFDADNCFDWFKGVETGDILIYMPV